MLFQPSQFSFQDLCIKEAMPKKIIYLVFFFAYCGLGDIFVEDRNMNEKAKMN